MRRRIGLLALLFGSLTAAATALIMLRIGLNTTPSMPIGLYRFFSVDRPLLRGDIVQICPPAEVAEVFAQRGGLQGPCLYRTPPLLKFVAGIPGDVVELRDNVVTVNGTALPGSATVPRRQERFPSPQIARGRYVLGPGRIWLWTPYPRSWDSRYFGPVAAAGVRSFARPVLAGGSWADWNRGLRVLASIQSQRRKAVKPPL